MACACTRCDRAVPDRLNVAASTSPPDLVATGVAIPGHAGRGALPSQEKPTIDDEPEPANAEGPPRGAATPQILTAPVPARTGTRPTFAFLIGPVLDRHGDAGVYAAAAAYAPTRGWTAVSPLHLDLQHPGPCPAGPRTDGHTQACWYTAAVFALRRCHVVLLLPGWRTSPWARLWLRTARDMDLLCAFLPGAERLPDSTPVDTR